ncbi:hepatitis A virus cellular receptor 1 homolog [Sparus aurata]|uniref:hepatitis A virus cellular receptor 1 homolog n=1 Tax=Sparus aurata TaxID=8175 RepID=UPI0011C1175B|nr:hepatitis A virus cellular receptor 1 homolog [Sparus aurata]XP_030278172.1 hepatitis A virus cellular receptor 1 homolog [Sparus aurata]
MKVRLMLICFIFVHSALQEEITGFIDVGISILTGKEGGTITYECTVFVSGSRKIFCRKKCGKKDILVQTTGDRAQRGRYSIKSKKATIVSPSVMYVSIANLTKSDSGLYRCRVDNHLFPDEEFEIRVEDAPVMLKTTTTLPPPTTSVTSDSTPTPSDFTPTPSASTPTPSDFTLTPTPATSAAATGVQLYVRLTLVVIFIVSSAAVLIFCRRRASKAEDPPVEADYVNVTEANPVYEELREDRRNRSPPVGISAGHNLSCSQYAEDSV